ncbi:DUF2384 domain-containing protein [Beggiatoa alba]|nr:DUF2384 domain-containing protein [Beggiatoa alba]
MKTLNHDEQVSLTLRVITVLADWQLTSADKICLLALPDNTRTRSIQKYQQGVPLPFDNTVREHVDHLLGIEDSLRLANPRNSQAGSLWIRRPLPRLQGRTPLAIMLEDGLAGIIAVRKHLDCSFDWYTDQQNHPLR